MTKIQKYEMRVSHFLSDTCLLWSLSAKNVYIYKYNQIIYFMEKKNLLDNLNVES